MDFKNKVVIVTGSSSGIGAETAVQFAIQSAKVVITGRNEENLKKVAKQCLEAKGIEPLVIKADVKNIVDMTLKQFGQIDVLVNNAGMGAENKIQPNRVDLEAILNKSTQGVIYMNFGANLRSLELPLEKRNVFLNVFRRLNLTVLLKWEEETLEGKPYNVVIRKWLPQKEVLGHPNVKLFISHGGKMGTLEALLHGVPIVGIPIYADQYNNLRHAQQAGMAEILEYQDINEMNLETVVRAVIDTYRTKAKETSVRFKDRPVTALESAMFRIEYVIRNKGADIVKNPTRNLSFLAYHMLDVYAFILSVLATFIFAFVKIAKYFIRRESVSRTKPKRS